MVTAIAIALSASAQKKWTLTECIDYALQNNITLQQAKLQKQSATEERKQAKAALRHQQANHLATDRGWKMVSLP